MRWELRSKAGLIPHIGPQSLSLRHGIREVLYPRLLSGLQLSSQAITLTTRKWTHNMIRYYPAFRILCHKVIRHHPSWKGSSASPKSTSSFTWLVIITFMKWLQGIIRVILLGFHTQSLVELKLNNGAQKVSGKDKRLTLQSFVGEDKDLI